ncbi:endoglucanase 20 [Cryptomeria japonica]|uniref:endoglucanase 20 n=1 Tax=Cryptomeria japonica TaxID=3369 RepID=UPI0027DA6A47|nr:endoglucanase 20 [Cryptomeria japonica]
MSIGISETMFTLSFAGLVLVFAGLISAQLAAGGIHDTVDAIDYQDALEKAILFFEGQRSGKLPSNQRVTWRGDSALSDGSLANVDLRGGYYDAGDNVKFVWPMSFTVTMLSWAAVHYRPQLSQAEQLNNTLEAIRWGTDFIMKAHTSPTTLWTQVGDGNKDHGCWERAEEMDTARTLYKISSSSPGSEAAADASAALSSAAIVWKNYNSSYAGILLNFSQSLFNFANEYRGSYSASCPFYCSYSGYNDELLWAAAWLYKATNDQTYLNFVVNNQGWSQMMSEFSWDNKFAGAQLLLAQEFLSGQKSLEKYKTDADSFICALLPKSPTKQITTTPGGLLFIRDSSNLQYVNTATFAMLVYSNIIKAAKVSSISCGGVSFKPSEIRSFAKSQVDYILGKNPMNMSYMVGVGSKYPQELHHRGASIPSIHVMPEKVDCNDGFSWYNKDSANPNVHTGALVGGPGSNDNFSDKRSDYSHLEPTTYMNAAFVGSLAAMVPRNPYPNAHQQNEYVAHEA